MTSALATSSLCALGARRPGWLPALAPASGPGTGDRPAGRGPVALGTGGLPGARMVLAVTARPGPESADLGGLLYAFRAAGADLALLCLTRGEASALNSTCRPLEAVRPWELQVAAGLLGVRSVAVADYPDGGLGYCPIPELAQRVQRAIAQHDPDLILVPDPAGDPDDARVACAVCQAAGQAEVPVAARTTPDASGSWPVELGSGTETARAVQRCAAKVHASQSEALPEILRTLDGLSSREHLRWLLPAPASVPRPWSATQVPEVAPASQVRAATSASSALA